MTWSSSTIRNSLLAAVALASPAALASAQGGPALRLSVPVLCDMARDCSIQKYVDRVPGPERRDYRCGTITTDAHDGTDFRLRRFQDLDRNVKVVSAAAGTVLRVRDGVPDASVRDAFAPLPQDRLAGNAVVVGHGDGWEIQYSHLKQGSVRVRPGQAVSDGTELGAVGLSGNTEYPHLHFEVRRDGKTVDPFAANDLVGCNGQQTSLWSAAAARDLSYRATVVLSAGFTSEPALARPSVARSPDAIQNPASLLLWGNVSGVQSGDVEKIRITAPNGGVIVAREQQILRNSLVWVGYAGARRPVGGWQPGAYSGTYQLTRNGVLVGELSMTQNITG